MQTTEAERCRQASTRVLAPAAALLLLTIFAVPAGAQRAGRHGGSGHGRISGHSGHHGAGHRGAHRYGRSDGYRGYGSGHYSRGYRGHHGPARHYGYGYSGYRYHGHYGYRTAYRGPLYGPYRGHGYLGIGTYGYPGVSITYAASPYYVSGGERYASYTSSYRHYQPRYEAYAIQDAEPEAGVTEPAEAYDARPRPAKVKLTVEPGDASVYLDDRFLGLASELPAELWIDPGSHRLEVVRPGLAGREIDLELEAGEEHEVDARLQAAAPH